MGKMHKNENNENMQEGLDEYIRVSRPSVMVVIISLLAVLAAVIVWGVVGTLPVTETVTGLVVDISVYDSMYPEEVERVKNGERLRKTWVPSEDAMDSTAPVQADKAEEYAASVPAEETEDSTAPVQPEDVQEPSSLMAQDDAGNKNIAIFCFLDASRYNGQAIADFGDEAVLKMPDQTTYRGTIENRYDAPISMEEAKKILFDNEWVLEQCVRQNYNWWLIIRPETDISKYEFTLTEVTLLTEEVAPIQFLMNNQT